MDTQQLPDMLPDSVKNATPEEVQKFPYGFAFLSLIAGISFLSTVVLWINNARLKDLAERYEQCQVEKKADREAREKAEAKYADVLLKLVVSQGTLKALVGETEDTSQKQ